MAGRIFPDLIAEIDERLLTGNNDSAEAIMALKDIDLTMVENSGEVALRTCQALQLYINHVIEPDTVLPYGLTCEGVVAFRTEAGNYEHYQIQNDCDLMKLDLITLYQFPTLEGDVKLQFALSGAVGGRTEGELAPIIVGMDAVTALYSVWAAYYG